MTSRRLTVFSFVCALATLIHQNYLGRLVNLQAESLLSFAALWQIVRPSSAGRLLLLSAAQLITMIWELPHVSNHWLLLGVANLGLLLILLPPWLRFRVLPEQKLAATASMLRTSLVIVYAYATFAKLNHDFFDPAVSCAVQHYGWLTVTFPFLPNAFWTATPAIVGTLLIEAALATGLAFARTRVPALILGWGFHLALGWNAFYDFSMVAAVFYVAFLPDAVFEGWERTLERFRWLDRLCRALARTTAGSSAFLVLAALMLVLMGSGNWLDASPRALHLAANQIGKLLFVAVWLALGGLAGASFWVNGIHTNPAVEHWSAEPILWIPIALLLVNGLMPFVGLKTEHSFTMFSNIQTEGDRWNHYLVPRGFRLFGFQDDLVRIHASSDPRLAELARRDVRLVPFHLRTLVERDPEMRLRYEFEGQLHTVASASNDPFLAEHASRWLAKWMLFRPIQPLGQNVCAH
jgi:hypothetical protein